MDKHYIGYARVSSREQNEERQIIALTEYGVQHKNIYTDHQSGKNFDRTNYKRMLKRLKKGDVLIIKSIDRLGRNYKDVIKQWQFITQEKQADIVVLDMQLLDTRQHKDLLGTFVADMVLQILSYVSENERLNIRQRQAEGIAAAKARGVKFGRPKEYYADNYIDIFKDYRSRKISKKQAIQLIGCSEHTFYRMLSILRKGGKVL